MKRCKPHFLAGTALLLATAGCLSDPRISSREEFPEPIVITTAIALQNNDILKFNDTWEDNPVTRWAKRKLNIVQKITWVFDDGNDSLVTRIKLALSSGEPLPDVLFLTHEEIPELLPILAESGEIMEMKGPFEQYAPERVKDAYANNPGVWNTVSYDGRLWGLPQISDGKVGDPILWIRQDWLDRFQLEAPATIRELERIFELFTNHDPDGNGVRDTIGIAVAGKNTLNDWMGDLSFVFGAYGDQPYQWNRMADGKLAYGSVQPSVKQALARIARWYESGYLHPDFGTHDEQEAVSLFMKGEAGIIFGPGWMGGWPLGHVQNENADIAIKPYPVPAGDSGRVGRVGTKLSYGSYFFRKDFSHMDAAFAYWDEVYGSLIEDPESDFRHGFAEGYDYLIENGEYVYDFPGATATAGNLLLLAPGSAPPGVIAGESLEQRVYKGIVTTPYERKLAATSSRLFLEGRIVGDLQLDASQRDEFTGPFMPSMIAKSTYLKKLEKETFLKIVYGEAPLGSFDDFVAMWHRSGGREMTDEVNAWDQSLGGPAER